MQLHVEYRWAHAYFKKLMEEGHIDSSYKEIHKLMLQNCGTEPVPPLGTVAILLAVRRKKEADAIRPNGHKFVWARHYFDSLMEEGHVSSAGPRIYDRMEQNCGTEPMPTENTVRRWLAETRKHVQQVQAVVHHVDTYAWARSYFNELMDQGHINSSADQILTLMQQNCDHPAPSTKSVGEWLAAKRKEFGRRGGTEYLWATCYFNDLMETDHLHSSKTTIHAMMNHNSPDEPVPSEDTLDHWLRAAKAQRSCSVQSQEVVVPMRADESSPRDRVQQTKRKRSSRHEHTPINQDASVSKDVNQDASFSKDVMRRFNCKARYSRHSPDNAFIDIPVDVSHGYLLYCSDKMCRASGKAFRWCAVCEVPAAKRNFHQRHAHGGRVFTPRVHFGKRLRLKISSDPLTDFAPVQK